MKRREMVLSSSGLLMLLYACKQHLVRSTISPQNRIPPNQGPARFTTDENTTATTSSTNASTDVTDSSTGDIELTKSCDLKSRTTIDLAQIPQVDEILTPLVKAYGSLESATVAVGFPKYQYQDLSDIYLCDETGQLIAHKALFGANDVMDHITIRPVIFEHVQLKPKIKLGLVIKAESKFQKFVMANPLAFEAAYDLKPIRKLYRTITPDQWSDYFFTDMVGNYLTVDPSLGLSAWIPYMMVIAYKSTNQGAYERTILRLS